MVKQILRLRNLVWLGIGLAVVALLAYALRPQPLAVDLATIDRGDIVVTVGDEGQTRVRNIYVVSAPIPGRMLRINSEAGDRVTGGETMLARFLPSQPTLLDTRTRRQAEAAVETAEAALALARAERGKAEAELEFARNELKRAEALSNRGTISISALERAATTVETSEAALATARAALRVRQHELETARAALIEPNHNLPEGKDCCIDLIAPVSGQVLRILQKSEAVVAAGTPLIELGNRDDLEVVVDLLSNEAVSVREGAEVSIDGWGGPAALAGKVRRVEPYGFTKVSALGIEEQRVNVVIDFADPSDLPERLGHGFRVDVRIVVEARQDAALVPLSALFRAGDEWAVFATDSDRAVRRIVRIGVNDGRMAEVLGGLEAGEQVIEHPGDRVEDGSAITPRQ